MRVKHKFGMIRASISVTTEGGLREMNSKQHKYVVQFGRDFDYQYLAKPSSVVGLASATVFSSKRKAREYALAVEVYATINELCCMQRIWNSRTGKQIC